MTDELSDYENLIKQYNEQSELLNERTEEVNVLREKLESIKWSVLEQLWNPSEDYDRVEKAFKQEGI